MPGTDTEQSLAADGAIACFSSDQIPQSLNADRAPQLKASVGLIVNLLFPPDGPAYAGIGIDARSLPGTILGVLVWIGIVLVFANPFRKD